MRNSRASKTCFDERSKWNKEISKNLGKGSPNENKGKMFNVGTKVLFNKKTLFWDWMIVKYGNQIRSLLSPKCRQRFKDLHFENPHIQNMTENEVIDKL